MVQRMTIDASERDTSPNTATTSTRVMQRGLRRTFLTCRFGGAARRTQSRSTISTEHPKQVENATTRNHIRNHHIHVGLDRLFVIMTSSCEMRSATPLE
jgi:hypothetical protein